MELGDRIGAWLRAKGMSQKALAEQAEISRGCINGYVHNEFAPSNANLQRIVRVFGVSMEKFYGRVPKPKKAS